jgi:hypothetical protein
MAGVRTECCARAGQWRDIPWGDTPGAVAGVGAGAIACGRAVCELVFGRGVRQSVNLALGLLLKCRGWQPGAAANYQFATGKPQFAGPALNGVVKNSCAGVDAQ